MGLFNLADKLVDSAYSKISETVFEVETKIPYLLGKVTKPTPESLKEMENFAEDFLENPHNMFEKFKNMSEGELFLFSNIIAMMEGHITREDVQHHFELKDAYSNGYRQGNVDAAKKFATLLEQSDNFRIGAFAVGYHVARCGDNLNAKLGVIVDALGTPDSPILSNYVRNENNKILCNKPEFAEICTKYLKSLNTEQLKSIDNFLREIINSGGASVNEVNFFNNLWKSYLKQRDIDTDSIF